MIDYVVAIPTYKRYEELINKTLSFLAKHSINPSKIYIFVANKTEKKIYESYLNNNKYKIIIGKKGITNQRNFISKYFDKNQYIISLDDDIEDILELKQQNLVSINDFNAFILSAYRTLKENNLYLWGIYPTPNPFYMYKKTTTDLRFIIGAVHGYINRNYRSLYLNPKTESKEDYHKTLLFFIRDGGVVRFNNIAFKSKPNADGGLGKNRFDKNKKAAKYLGKKYPKMVKRTRRANGTAEVRLNRTFKIKSNIR